MFSKEVEKQPVILSFQSIDLNLMAFEKDLKNLTLFDFAVKPIDEDQGERTPEAQAQAQSEAQAQSMISSPIMPQRITRSKAQTLGDEHQLMSLFVIFLE